MKKSQTYKPLDLVNKMVKIKSQSYSASEIDLEREEIDQQSLEDYPQPVDIDEIDLQVEEENPSNPESNAPENILSQELQMTVLSQKDHLDSNKAFD
jgi:hypothetical protein